MSIIVNCETHVLMGIKVLLGKVCRFHVGNSEVKGNSKKNCMLLGYV
jgi:hypothetical protein